MGKPKGYPMGFMYIMMKRVSKTMVTPFGLICVTCQDRLYAAYEKYGTLSTYVRENVFLHYKGQRFF